MREAPTLSLLPVAPPVGSVGKGVKILPQLPVLGILPISQKRKNGEPEEMTESSVAHFSVTVG